MLPRVLFIILVFISLFNLNGVCQSPNPPIFQEASVLPGTGNVKLKWKLTDSGDVQIRIWDQAISGYNKITEIKDTSITEYIDYTANANIQPRLYWLWTIINGDEDDPIDSKRFPTNLLTYEYDSCKAEIKLSWINRSINFTSTYIINFSSYEIWAKENSGAFQKIGSTTEQSFTIPNIKEKTNYTFYIAAIPEHAPDSRSTSNTISFYSEMSEPPAYINPVIASINSGIVHLEFDVDPNSELTKYKLLRSTSLSGPFDTIQTINSTSDRISVNDPGANSDKRVYYYKLLAYNNCDQPIWEAESEVINTICLTVTNNDNTNNLEWNLLKEETNPASNYRIYRSIGTDNQQQIDALFNNETTYQDNIEDLIGTNSGSKICYFIIGRENTSQDPNNSNIACATIEPKVYIPDAFTPDGNGKNDFFDIKFSFLPENYTLIIYNRWSNIVFESTDPEIDWDGRSLNGKPVPAGAYIYYLKIVTENNQTIEKRGNITVIYP